MGRITEIVAFLILGMATHLPIGDCYTPPGKGGYVEDSEGRYYSCFDETEDAYCRRICSNYNAGNGYCYGAILGSCYCEELTLYGGYPVDWKDNYYYCIDVGTNRKCENVCRIHNAGYGYCYGVLFPKCYCEMLTDENQRRKFINYSGGFFNFVHYTG